MFNLTTQFPIVLSTSLHKFNDENMSQLTELDAWKALKSHAESNQFHKIATVNQSHSFPFSLQQKGIQIDFRYQRFNEKTRALLVNLAHEQDLEKKIADLMCGCKVNTSEKRPALHTALRAVHDEPLIVDGLNIMADVVEARERMREMAEQIRASQWYGYSGKAITDIVNIGIGGSDFGPRFCVDALAEYTASHLAYHFISDADPCAFRNTVKNLNQETTLFIVSSKSFSTNETLMNARKAMDWFGNHTQIKQHFIAVTANINKAKAFGIQHILPIWDWVGGRFSFCSAINLIGCVALGFQQFMELLAGAHSMDEHFKQAPLVENMPVMLGLVGIWNINFLHISNLILLVYARQLEKFVPYLQQLDMESNGKSTDKAGRSINYATSPMVWGGMGNQVQHSYFQLLCQGSHSIAADFISMNDFNQDMINQVCRAKIQVLAKGIYAEDMGYIPGGMPLNHIRIDACTPFNLGALIALYEHKTYVQSCIWNINAFDQPGVESAKRLLFAGSSMHVE